MTRCAQCKDHMPTLVHVVKRASTHVHTAQKKRTTCTDQAKQTRCRLRAEHIRTTRPHAAEHQEVLYVEPHIKGAADLFVCVCGCAYRLLFGDCMQHLYIVGRVT
jgi:hypothetical protein